MAKIKIREPGDYIKNLSVSQRDLNSSLLTTGIRNEIAMIKIEKIRPFKGQARIDFDEEGIVKLAETIQRHGVRQPLTLLQSEDDNYFEVISGERRLRAAKISGLEKIPAIIIQSRELAEELALIENIHRKDLHPIEIGKSYIRLLETGFVASQNELAQKIGVSKGQVSEYISFAKLPKNIIEMVVKNKLTARSILRKLLNFDDEEKLKEFLSQQIEKLNSEKEFGKEKKEEKENDEGKNHNDGNIPSIKLVMRNNKWSLPSKTKFSSISGEHLVELKNTLCTILQEIDLLLRNINVGSNLEEKGKEKGQVEKNEQQGIFAKEQSPNEQLSKGYSPKEQFFKEQSDAAQNNNENFIGN